MFPLFSDSRIKLILEPLTDEQDDINEIYERNDQR